MWGVGKVSCKLKILAVIKPWDAAVAAGKEGKAIKQIYLSHRDNVNSVGFFMCPSKKTLRVSALLNMKPYEFLVCTSALSHLKPVWAPVSTCWLLKSSNRGMSRPVALELERFYEVAECSHLGAPRELRDTRVPCLGTAPVWEPSLPLVC